MLIGGSKPAKAEERGKAWRVFAVGMPRFRSWIRSQGWRLGVVREGCLGN